MISPLVLFISGILISYLIGVLTGYIIGRIHEKKNQENADNWNDTMAALDGKSLMKTLESVIQERS